MSVDAEKYKVRVGDGDGAVEVELGVSSITVPAVTLKPGPVPEVLIGHSKGLKQILLERGLITVGEKTKGACDTNDKKKRMATKAQSGIGQTESADVPKHAGMAGGTACCLEYLLSEQPDFKRQQNAIQELVISRGHHCIFSPSSTPSSISSSDTGHGSSGTPASTARGQCRGSKLPSTRPCATARATWPLSAVTRARRGGGSTRTTRGSMACLRPGRCESPSATAL